MLPTNTTEIMRDKGRLRLYLGGCLLFMALGTWFIARPDNLKGNPFLHDPRLVQLLGLACLVLFGAFGYLVLRQLGSHAPALVLTPEGFTDQSSGTAGGFVPWADVAGIREVEVMRQQLLAVILHDPTAYIARQPNALKRQVLTTNLSSYGSPIQLSAGALLCTHAELKAAMQARLAAWQGRG